MMIILTTILVISFILAVSKATSKSKSTDSYLIQLCSEYAKGHPETAINQERREKMGHLWKDFDWFKSCLIN